MPSNVLPNLLPQARTLNRRASAMICFCAECGEGRLTATLVDCFALSLSARSSLSARGHRCVIRTEGGSKFSEVEPDSVCFTLCKFQPFEQVFLSGNALLFNELANHSRCDS